MICRLYQQLVGRLCSTVLNLWYEDDTLTKSAGRRRILTVQYRGRNIRYSSREEGLFVHLEVQCAQYILYIHTDIWTNEQTCSCGLYY
jgi:hypothetical protein